MKRFSSFLLGCTMLVCFLIASERNAFGYIDPGSGLLALQGFASILGTAAFYFRKRIRALFGRKAPKQSALYAADSKGDPETVTS